VFHNTPSIDQQDRGANRNRPLIAGNGGAEPLLPRRQTVIQFHYRGLGRTLQALEKFCPFLIAIISKRPQRCPPEHRQRDACHQ
jgi:hypothetical protein